MLARRTVLALGAATLIAACGGSPADDVRSAITGYYQAFASADGSGACSKLSSKTRTALQQAAGGRSCSAAIVQAAHQPNFTQIRPRLKDAKVSAIKIAGSTATAQVSLGAVHVPVSLVKEGGDWKIESSQAAGG